MHLKTGVAQTYLYEHIPITKQLGVEVVTYDGNAIDLKAPLAPNINHRDSVFGGSLASVAILSGWTVLHLKLMDEQMNCRLVIQKSTTDFLTPVLSDFQAQCRLPSHEKWTKFLNMIRKKGKARIKLRAEIWENDRLCGIHEGIFVAITSRVS